VSVGVDRLNGIIQKLVQLGQGPTPASKLAKIKAAIQTEELKELFLSVAMLPKATTTFETIKDACEEFESAKEKLKKKLVTADGEELHFTKEKSTKKVVCSHCKKIGHSANKCFDKIKLQKLAQLKRAGKSAAKQGTGNGPQQPGSAAYTGCRKCGDMDHKAADCPKKKSDKKRKKHEYEKYVDDSDESDESNMFAEQFDDDEVNFVDPAEEIIYLDSCASSKLFIVRDQSFLETFTYVEGSIQRTKKDSLLETQGVGEFGDWKAIKVSHDAVKNIISAGILREKGYGLTLLRIPRVVELDTGKQVLVGLYNSTSGMPYVNLHDILHLPNWTVHDDLHFVSRRSDEVNFLDDMGVDRIDQLHFRTGHVSKPKLLEGYRHMLFTGSGLNRNHLSKSAKKRIDKWLCKSCARAKITRHSFRVKNDDQLFASVFLEKVTADISVYLNCPSREGYKYVLVFTDIATKYFWEYPLKNRSGDEVLRCVKHLVEVALKKFPGFNRLANYHADGGSELIDQKIKSYLLDKFGTVITFTARDTPELNSVSEKKFRTLGEQTLSMLADSGLPKSFWWDAYRCACHITRMMPTRTCKGWMSPMECVPGGSVPNLSWLRRWGCKAYVLTPRSDRRKDWEDKAMIGFFLGYPTEKNGYRVMLGDTVVTSVHVLFDEDIPERSADYFKELDEAKVAVDPEERHVADFDYLVGRCHEDGGLMYKITRVVVRKGLIVGYRALINSGREQIEDKTPIHVSDLKEMTEDLARRMSKGTVDHDDGNSGVVPDEHQEDVRPLSNSVATPGERTPTVNLE